MRVLRLIELASRTECQALRKSLSPFSRSVDNVDYGIISFDYRPPHKLQYYSSYVNSNVAAVRTTALHMATALAVRAAVKTVVSSQCSRVLRNRPSTFVTRRHVESPENKMLCVSKSKLVLKFFTARLDGKNVLFLC